MVRAPHFITDPITWTCHICGDCRPDEAISVVSTDLSEEQGFPEGTYIQNIRYCNDRPSCQEKAQTHRLAENKG